MQPFPVTRIAHIQVRGDSPAWLVEGLWGDQAVGFIGSYPKAGKTWLAIELAVAVASGKPCLGRFSVPRPGPVLLYAAEDTAAAIRERTANVARARGVTDIERLAVGLITEPSLRLDAEEHQQRLALTLTQIKPRLLVLDPLVRLHSADENSASDVSSLLGFLRALQREHQVAVVLVHHVRKASASQPGQALRGSGDLHAWSDSSLYLLRGRQRLELHAEHRAHPSPPPLHVELQASPSTHLHVVGDLDNDCDGHDDEPIAQRIIDTLKNQPMNRGTLRQTLGVRNERLGHALKNLEAIGRLKRVDGLLVPVPAS